MNWMNPSPVPSSSLKPFNDFSALPKAPPAPGKSPTGYDLPNLPQIAQAPQAGAGLTQQLPPAPPPVKKPSIWDDQHRKDTLLAISAGILQGDNFAEGMGSVAKNLLAQRQALRSEGKPTLGGPDDAFEITTDPVTGKHTFTPIQAALDYQRSKTVKPAQRADMVGRVHYAISQLPEEQRAAAWADVQANPEAYSLTDEDVATEYDPQRSAILANTGMTVSQALTRSQASENADAAEVARQEALRLRGQMVDIARRRTDASISQGQQRIGIAQQALNNRGSGKGGKTSISEQSNADLIAFIRGN